MSPSSSVVSDVSPDSGETSVISLSPSSSVVSDVKSASADTSEIPLLTLIPDVVR